MMSQVVRFLIVTLSLLIISTPVIADDSQTIDKDHWEFDLSSSGAKSTYGWSVLIPTLEVDYGITDSLQAHAAMPLGLNAPTVGQRGITSGSLELGLKYNFLKESEDVWYPAMAIYPLVELPVGNPNMNFGTGFSQLLLPLWIEKTFGDYRIFGGGGYAINPGIKNKNYVYTSIDFRYRIIEPLEIYTEINYQSWNNNNYKPQTGIVFGGSYDINETWHIFVNVGTGLQNRNATNQISYAIGLQISL